MYKCEALGFWQPAIVISNEEYFERKNIWALIIQFQANFKEQIVYASYDVVTYCLKDKLKDKILEN